ncbi:MULTISPECIES: distal tail protein Dit [Bacillus cereus group]|uniref:Phage tail fiber protein n=1 Tax=Bacillus cereus (strain AH187) TaxID=405534 RepID=B7HP77_BACC7|nr:MULTISPECIES: distal tail protein Dit [Bacillus cereus group]ACJ78318.1 phage tail fiber protein [Bacillus cereus AH187]MBR9741998.1 phage tail protein [Bacillus paranthracis]MCU4950236.1 phage tail family protein [Bacillus paranthracis]MDA1982103.1 phage tail family protein [Bacillus cereus group sp. Bcc13]MDX5778663.1 phage tail family protein [Bacillus cereus group sp. DSM 4312]
MSSFSFNGERKSYIHIERGWKRPIWAPLRRNFLSVPSYPGARLLNTQTEMRVFSVPVGIIAPSGVDMKILSEDIASWLITDQPKELIFDTEPDRTYLAVVDEEFDADEFVEIGQGNLKFICPMPYKLGKTNTHKFTQEWSTETTSYFTNKGSVEAPALIEMTVKKPSTFLDVWFGEYPYNRDYFRIGYPLKTEQLPVERNQRLIWDEMTTTVGWSKVSSMEDGNPVGEMESDGYQFYCSNYGTGTGKGWNGAAVKKNIPNGPVQDFIMQAYVTCKSKRINEMGRVEIAILDENSKVLSKIAMTDVFWQAEQNFGTMVIGYDNKPGRRSLIHESGYYPNTWNQYQGRLWIARTGNVWEAYISKFLPGTEKDDSERFVRWTDENNYHMEKAAQIQISIMQWQDVPPVEAMTVSDLKFWKVNLNTQNNPPYIFDTGDKIIIDTEKSLVTINGKNAINLKDIFSNFPNIIRGENRIDIMPPDVKATVSYRERYR